MRGLALSLHPVTIADLVPLHTEHSRSDRSLQGFPTGRENSGKLNQQVMSFILIGPATRSRPTPMRLLKNNSPLTIPQVSEFILSYVHRY